MSLHAGINQYLSYNIGLALPQSINNIWYSDKSSPQVTPIINNNIGMLKHWGVDKIGFILQAKFWINYFLIKFCYSNITEICYHVVNWQ